MPAQQHYYTHDGDNDVACDALHNDDDDVSPCVVCVACAVLEDEAENACDASHDADAVALVAEHPTLRILRL